MLSSKLLIYKQVVIYLGNSTGNNHNYHVVYAQSVALLLQWKTNAKHDLITLNYLNAAVLSVMLISYIYYTMFKKNQPFVFNNSVRWQMIVIKFGTHVLRK